MSIPRVLTLAILPGRFAIWQIPPGDPLPESAKFISLTSLGSDRSVVLSQEALPPGARAARGYRCLRLEGEFPLEETGILARLSVPLARSGIPLLVISTFLTDYLLLREGDLGAARGALSADGIRILPPESSETEEGG